MNYLFMILIAAAPIWAGSVTQDETTLRALTAQLQKTQAQLERGEAELQSFLRETDSLKAAHVSDALITRRTARAYEQSRKIEELRGQIKWLESALRQIKSTLYRHYSLQIDSLTARQKPGSHSRAFSKQLFILMSKRLSVSPIAGKLPFNPKEITAIDSSVTGDSLGLKIAVAYLTQADSSLSAEIDAMQTKEEELRQMTALRAKAGEFLEEMDADRFTGLNQNTATKPNAYGTDESGGKDADRFGVSEDRALANTQSATYFSLMHRFESNREPGDDSSALLDFPELIRKLSQTRGVLQSYRRFIRAKLKQLKGQLR